MASGSGLSERSVSDIRHWACNQVGGQKSGWGPKEGDVYSLRMTAFQSSSPSILPLLEITPLNDRLCTLGMSHPYFSKVLSNQFYSLVHRMSQRKYARELIFSNQSSSLPTFSSVLIVFTCCSRGSADRDSATQFCLQLGQTKPAQWQQLRTTRD